MDDHWRSPTCSRASSGTSRYLACRRPLLPTTTSGKSSTRMERSCSVSTRGVLTGIPADPQYGKPGNGLLLFFRVDNFDVALPRARALVSRLEEEPHVNPNTGTAEFRSEILTDTTSPSVRSVQPNPYRADRFGSLCRWKLGSCETVPQVRVASKAERLASGICCLLPTVTADFSSSNVA